LSADQNNPSGGDSKGKGGTGNLPGPLPGLGGAKPGGAAPLPGLGGGKAPLPGLAGGAAPLPGLGGGKAPLPGLAGPTSKPVIAPFQQQTAPPAPAGPDPEQIKRDPFAQGNLPAQRPSYMPHEGLIGADPTVSFSEAEAGRSRKPLYVGMAILAVVCIGLGYMGGSAVSRRVELNIAIRDALIVKWELDNVRKLFDEVEAVVNTALTKAAAREYDKVHVDFLADKVKGNPVKPTIFTERNYKRFDASAVQWINNYFNKWGELYEKIEEHRRKTRNDEASLSTAGEEFKKLLTTNYGVVFTRDDKKGGQLIGNIVVLGAMAEKGDKVMAQVQVDTGTFADEREIYSPEGEDSALTKEPDRFIVVVGDNSKTGVLKNATQAHFEAYAHRIKAISDLMKTMRETQTNLLNKLTEICSQDPAGLFGGIDPEEELQEYIKKAESGIGAAPVEESGE
jgi:hypothetical protein